MTNPLRPALRRQRLKFRKKRDLTALTLDPLDSQQLPVVRRPSEPHPHAGLTGKRLRQHQVKPLSLEATPKRRLQIIPQFKDGDQKRERMLVQAAEAAIWIFVNPL